MIEPIEKNVDFTNLSNVRRKYDVYELNGIKLTRSANEPVWEERYRPRKIYDLIMPSKVTKQLEEYKNQGDLKSLLLYSQKGGLGKTSVSQVMIHELGADFLTLSANIERGVAAIKEKVVPFAQNLSMFGDRKIVCIEEIGDATPAQVDSLKSVLDRYASNVSIIITTNSMSNISQPLRTRFNIIDFNTIPTEDIQQMTIKTILRIKSILQIEGVEYTDDDIKYLFATYKFSFREIVNTLQSSVIDGKLVLSRNAISSTSTNELLKLINDKDFKRLAELSMGVNHSEFLEHLNNEYLNLLQDANHIPAIIMIMNTLQESLAKNVAFPNIAFMKACIDMINQKLMFKV